MMEQLRKKLATSVDKFFTTSQMMMTGVGQWVQGLQGLQCASDKERFRVCWVRAC
jgi:hypothetical protein